MTNKNVIKQFLDEQGEAKLLKLIIERPRECHSVIQNLMPVELFQSQTEFPLQHIAQIVYDYYAKNGYDNLTYWMLRDMVRCDKYSNEIEIEQMQAMINMLETEITVEEADYILNKAKNVAKAKIQIVAYSRCAELAMSGDTEGISITENKMREKLHSLASGSDIGVPYSIEGSFEDMLDVVPTNIKGLDDAINGGLRKGFVSVILAPTSVGKSTFATILAQDIALQGKKVIQIFFEEVLKEIRDKHTTKLIGMTSDDAINNKDEYNRREAEFKDKAESLGGNLLLSKYDSGVMTVDDIENKIVEYKKMVGCAPDVVILDYFSCLCSKDDNYKTEDANIRKIANIASKYNIAFVVTEQTNRGGKKNKGDSMGSMQGSISKFQVCALCIELNVADNEDGNYVNLYITKNRHCGTKGLRSFKNAYFNRGTLELDLTQCEEDEPFDKIA